MEVWVEGFKWAISSEEAKETRKKCGAKFEFESKWPAVRATRCIRFVQNGCHRDLKPSYLEPSKAAFCSVRNWRRVLGLRQINFSRSPEVDES